MNFVDKAKEAFGATVATEAKALSAAAQKKLEKENPAKARIQAARLKSAEALAERRNKGRAVIV